MAAALTGPLYWLAAGAAGAWFASRASKKKGPSKEFLEEVQALENSYEQFKAQLIEDFEELVEPWLGE